MKPKDRKDRIEMILAQCGKFDGNKKEEVQAWRRLRQELGAMTHPEARMPRFNALVNAIWIAASNDHT